MLKAIGVVGALAAASFGFATAAAADNITAVTPASLSMFLDAEDIEYELGTDDVGDPKFTINYYGVEFSVFYYGCTDGMDCDAIQFYSGYDLNGGVRLSKLNTWNVENRYSRAYISDEGSVWLEHDVFLGNHGMDADDFSQLMGIWTTVLKEFEEHIDF